MLLTIYIPTYNRCESILTQLININNCNSKEFRVIINDNHSTQSYQEISDFCKDKDNFIYQQNFVNIGADANILNGFLHCFDSKYLWILSDDDIIKEDAIATILDILDNNSLDLLFLTHRTLKNLEFYNYNQQLFYKNNIKYADGAGLISNVIYKSSFIKNSIPVGSQYIYTCFAHLAILIDSLKHKAKVVNIGASNFFIPNTALPPAHSTWYSKSYFGFVLLAELFENDIKKQFIDDWSNFWNLRHWHIKSKDQVAKINYIFAENYIKHKCGIFNLFRTKLIIWKFLTPLFLIYKKYK